jgi:hypothetical protein
MAGKGRVVKNWEKKYPPKLGWIRADLTMQSAAMMPVEKVKSFLTVNETDDYEFALLEQHGKRITAIYRKKAEVAS